MKFSQALTYYRERQHLSKSALAKKIGIKPEYIVNIESGDAKAPTYERCEQLAKILHLSDSEKTSFFTLAFEERQKPQDILFQTTIKHEKAPLNVEPSYPKEVLEALENPIALRALLATHKIDKKSARTVENIIKVISHLEPDKIEAVLKLLG